MKIFKSIKWRLQIWYGLILVLVLAGFGTAAYQLERNQQFRQVDNELHRRIGVLANALHHPPPPGQNFNRPPPNQFRDGAPPMLQRNRRREFHLPTEDKHFFDASNPDDFYFIIWMRDGSELARSTNSPGEPDIVINNDHSVNRIDQVSFLAPESSEKFPLPPKIMNIGKHRETLEFLPSGETIEVGCSIASELNELRADAIVLTFIGCFILFFGLAGGAWLVSRAIKPIEQISSIAVKISAGDLSQRISIAETESELGQLAAVLNSTFARLESAFAQQKQFASDAAHELRTPVSVILTQTQTTLNRKREAEDYRQTVETCQRAAQRMRKLISALLELARLDAGQEPMKRLRFDFSKTISDCVQLVKPIAEEHSIKISETLESIEIIGDSERLAQVVTNLLTNAIQFNHAEGEVNLKLESQNGFAVLTVSDTGTGIAPEDLPHVFDRFFRAEKSRSGAGNSGLGLAISKAIVAVHGGMIEVLSDENGGSSFIVRLPI